MSWLYVPGQAADSSPQNGSLDTALSATSNGTPTASKSSRPESATASSTTRLSGTMCEPSTDAPGVESWIASLRASHASHSAPPENGSPVKTAETSGLTLPGSFAKLDPVTSSWRMFQDSLPIFALRKAGESSESPTLGEYSLSWPRAGMTRHGIACRLPPLVPLTSGIASGLLPTPTATEGEAGGYNQSLHPGAKIRPSLAMMARRSLWPTPRASANENRQTRPTPSQLAGKHGLNLATAVHLYPTPIATDGDKMSSKSLSRLVETGSLNGRLWPTPRTVDSRNGRTSKGAKEKYSAGPTLTEAVWGDRPGGKLNPTWVEWLMGWPLGWTDLEPLATDRFQQWLEQHGIY